MNHLGEKNFPFDGKVVFAFSFLIGDGLKTYRVQKFEHELFFRRAVGGAKVVKLHIKLFSLSYISVVVQVT